MMKQQIVFSSALPCTFLVYRGSFRGFRVTLPYELLYMDDLVVIAETEDDLIKRLHEWKDNVENRLESKYE